MPEIYKQSITDQLSSKTVDFIIESLSMPQFWPLEVPKSTPSDRKWRKSVLQTDTGKFFVGLH